MSNRGYVYAIRVPGSAEVKVGRTKNPVEKRLKQLNTTAVLEDFELEFSLAVNDSVAVEKEAHRILGKSRVRQDREFFTSNPKRTRKAIQQAASNSGDSASGGIGRFTRKILGVMFGLMMISVAIILSLVSVVLATEMTYTPSEIAAVAIVGLLAVGFAWCGWKLLWK